MRVIPTAIGPVSVIVQNERTAYVRAGTGDAGSFTTDADPTEPVVVRGTPLTVRGHFKYNENAAAWLSKPGYLSVSPETAARKRAVAVAVGAALSEHITRAERQAAGDVAALADADDRDDQAAKLEACAKAMRDQAAALRAGGRTVYLEHRSNGYPTQFRTVEMPDGSRVTPALEPPDLRHTAVRYPLTADQLAAATERD